MCRRRFQVCKSLALLFRNSIPGHVARSPGRRANATGCKVGLELATDGIHLPIPWPEVAVSARRHALGIASLVIPRIAVCG